LFILTTSSPAPLRLPEARTVILAIVSCPAFQRAKEVKVRCK
jgi:hypothetical protein